MKYLAVLPKRGSLLFPEFLKRTLPSILDSSDGPDLVEGAGRWMQAQQARPRTTMTLRTAVKALQRLRLFDAAAVRVALNPGLQTQ
jgi:hypothetical protein